MTETRKLAAILVADVVGYSRLAGADEDRPLARLGGLRSDLIDPPPAAHHRARLSGVKGRARSRGHRPRPDASQEYRRADPGLFAASGGPRPGEALRGT